MAKMGKKFLKMIENNKELRKISWKKAENMKKIFENHCKNLTKMSFKKLKNRSKITN